MLSSVDGKIDGSALRAVILGGEDKVTCAMLKGEALIYGHTTMQQHFAEDDLFGSASNKPAGPQPVHVVVAGDVSLIITLVKQISRTIAITEVPGIFCFL
jgi:hypothetical protein